MQPKKKTLIFSHRGANQEAAENTRAAFDRALQYPIDGMETDVQLTRDEVAVLWHDRFMGKLSHPTKHIDDFDFAPLREMNFAAHFAATHPSAEAKPESVMSLDEFLAAYRTRTRLLLEIKNRDWEDVARHQIKVRQTLSSVGEMLDETIYISSFNLTSLIYAHQCRPGFPLIYNLEDYQTIDDMRAVLSAQPFLHGLCFPIANLDQAVVNLLRAQGNNIAVYTCNSDEEIGLALSLQVDILISDLPQKALQMRDAWQMRAA